MARYDPDVMVCQVNPSWVSDLPRAPGRAVMGKEREDGVDVVDVDGHPGIAGVWVSRGDHTCGVRLDPPLPDIAGMSPSARQQGSIMLRADDITELEGRYELGRAGDQVHLLIDQFGPWRTRQRRPLLAVLFRLPIFRRWPTTYRWQATLDLAATPEQCLTSRWTTEP